MEIQDTQKFRKDAQEFFDQLGATYKKEENSRKKITLWLLILATTLVIGIIVMAITIMRMMPLKQTEPIIAVVDSATGIIEKIVHLENDSDPSAFKMWIESTVYSIVKARYGYAYIGNGKSLEERYNNASIFMDEETKRDFLTEVSAENPNSPFSKLGKTGLIDVEITSINITEDKRFQVNFRTRMKFQGTEQVFSYSVLGSFITGNYENLSVDERRLNPFGFKTTGWSISQNASTAALQTAPMIEPAPVEAQASGATKQ